MSTRLLLATRNAGKLAELQRLLSSAVPGVEVIGLRDVEEYPEAPETGATFADNALLKAREAVRYTGLPAVADDSGLTVDALNGMPGILSARWSGRHGDDAANTARLIGTPEQPAESVQGRDVLRAQELLYDLDRNEVVARAGEGGTITGEFQDGEEETGAPTTTPPPSDTPPEPTLSNPPTPPAP